MKNLFKSFLFLVLLVAPLAAFSQDFVEYSSDGKVILANGSEIIGTVRYMPTSPGKVFVTPNGSTEKEKYKAVEVKEFTVQGFTYHSIKTGGEINVGKDGAFGRILNQPDSKIKIYLCESQPSIVAGAIPPPDKSYYASLPGEPEALNINGGKFMPFKKITKYLADCPDLVSKIEGKTEGYTYPMMTTDDVRLKVFLKVAEEYQSCK